MKNLFLIVILILFSMQSFAQKERKFIRKGNKYFNSAYNDTTKQDTIAYSKAEVSYRKAIEKNPESFDAAFNLGDALYKQKKFEEASNQFQALASSEKDKQKLAQTYHNLGNSLLQSNKLEESIEAYKNALRNNPKDMKTKYNLAFAQDKLKKQQQQKKQNKQNKDQKDNKDKQNKDKQNQDKNKQDKNKQDKQKQQQQKQNQDQQKQNQKKQQAKQNKISKEDAKRLLEAIQNDEKQVQKRLKKEKAKKSKRVNIEKDW
ncbi:MAG: hypothetical protein DRJ01_03305 [Bacteroidetes bacterium]|nr:MAG: hypothetical protein DRJ01_03305 [Bacteroidota bacterium]